MFSVCKSILKIPYKKSSLRFISSIFIIKNPSWIVENNNHIISNKTLSQEHKRFNSITYKLYSPAGEAKRHFSKKKGSKRNVEVEEESDSEIEEEYDEFIVGDENNIKKRNVPSLRLDTLLKTGFGITKKKVEQDFYAFKLRVNGNRVVKKSMNVHVKDELDRVKGFSPDTSKFIIVDRIIIRGVGSITGAGTYPVTMEVIKDLTIENYEEPWDPTGLKDLEV